MLGATAHSRLKFIPAAGTELEELLAAGRLDFFVGEKLAGNGLQYLELPAQIERKLFTCTHCVSITCVRDLPGRTLVVAMADPLDLEAINDIRFASNREVRPTIAPSNEIKAAIHRFYHCHKPLEKILGKITCRYASARDLLALKDSLKVIPEVMIPLVGHVNELRAQREIVDRVGLDLFPLQRQFRCLTHHGSTIFN
jgi:hypothetical protein